MEFRRYRTAALAAAAASVLLAAPVSAATASPAKAQPKAPGFLAAADIPDGSGTEWTAGRVTKGTTEAPPFCLESVLPAKGATWHRQYRSDLDTGALQLSVTSPSTSAAARLAAAAEKAVAACAGDWLSDTGATASWRDHGRLAVEEGAHVYGIQTEMPEGAVDSHLIGIGRDGRTVTFLMWGQMGGLEHTPVPAFKKATVKAVQKLH